VIINEQAQVQHGDFVQEKNMTHDNETIVAGKEGKGTIQ
jgi:hypothetical protein